MASVPASHRDLLRNDVEVIHPGDRVFFEPGEEHWHGASAHRFMTRLAMLEVDE